MDCKKILIVDDEKGFTSMLKLNLEAIGDFEVKVVNEANNALMTAKQFLPDIILLDIIMPNKEGPDVAIEIRNEPSLKNIPIVFLTATITRDEVASQNGWIGGNIFVAKPSSLKELLASIESSIGVR
ncbi:MAG: response regulator [Candidatus Omnitrophica bacterium]|nr:response regulator [Candidatus Omnitrophota bacterium]MBU1997136.1 response regulator [Candidatus Omnitrophota bacterium]MBU4334647.1 response regulator [Candidatus Omnitrophota bacterium]